MELDNLKARFIREFGIKNLSYIIDIDTWARDGIHDMRIPNFYTIKDTDIEIKNGTAKLRINTDMLISAFIYEGNPIDFTINNSYELLIRNDNNLGSKGFPTQGFIYASFNGGNINVKQNKGNIKIFYKDVPTDCNNETLIPNNPKVIRALMYYFIYRMSLSGYVHPVIDFQTALQLWEKEYPAAGNDASWFTEAELQAFTELWTNPLIGDLHRNNYIY